MNGVSQSLTSGTLTGTVNANDTNALGWILGADYDGPTTINDFFKGHMNEVLFFDGTLMEADREKVNQYLAGKWLVKASKEVFVDNATTHPEHLGTELRPRKLIKNAKRAVRSGGLMKVNAGTYNESPFSITENIRIRTLNGTVKVR